MVNLIRSLAFLFLLACLSLVGYSQKIPELSHPAATVELSSPLTRIEAFKDEQGRWKLGPLSYLKNGQWKESLQFKDFSWLIDGNEQHCNCFQKCSKTPGTLQFELISGNNGSVAHLILSFSSTDDCPYLKITQSQWYEEPKEGTYQGITFSLPVSYGHKALYYQFPDGSGAPRGRGQNAGSVALYGRDSAYLSHPPFIFDLTETAEIETPWLGHGIAIPFLGVATEPGFLQALFYDQTVLPDQIPSALVPVEKKPEGYFKIFQTASETCLITQPHPSKDFLPESDKTYIHSYHFVPLPIAEDKPDVIASETKQSHFTPVPNRLWEGIVKTYYSIHKNDYFSPVPLPSEINSNQKWLDITLKCLQDPRAYDPDYGYYCYWRSWEEYEPMASAWYTSKIVVPLYFYARFTGNEELTELAVKLTRAIANHQYGCVRERTLDIEREETQIGAFQDLWVTLPDRQRFPGGGDLEYYTTGSSFWKKNVLKESAIISLPLHALDCWALLEVGCDSGEEELIEAGLRGLDYLIKIFNSLGGQAEIWEAWDTIKMEKHKTASGGLFSPSLSTCASGEGFAALAFLTAYQRTEKEEYLEWAKKLLTQLSKENGNTGYFPDQPSGETEWQPFAPGTVQSLAKAIHLLGTGQGTYKNEMKKWLYHIMSAVLLRDQPTNPSFSHTKGLIYGATGEVTWACQSFVETPPAILELISGLDYVDGEDVPVLLSYASLMWPPNAYGLVEFSNKPDPLNPKTPPCTNQPLGFPCETVDHPTSWRQPRSAGQSLGVLLSLTVIAHSTDPEIFTFATDFYNYRAASRNVYVYNPTQQEKTFAVIVNFGAEHQFREIKKSLSLGPGEYTKVQVSLEKN